MRAVICKLACLVLILATTSITEAEAQEPTNKNNDFTLRVVIGAVPGGTFDLSARIIAKQMPNYLGANWTSVVSNMPGAGSLNAANFVLKNHSDREPMIAALASSIIINGLSSPDTAAKFDPTSFEWLGSTEAGDIYCLSLKEKEKRREDKAVFIVGASTVGSPSSMYGNLLKNALGTNTKIVHGYTGGQDMLLAIERNEIDAFCGFSIGGIEDLWPDRLAAGKLNLIYAFPTGKSRLPDSPGQNVLDFVPAKDKVAVETFLLQQIFVRPYGVPANMSANMKSALRLAFEKTIASEDFKQAFARSKTIMNMAKGDEVTTAIRQIVNAPPDTLARIRELISQ